MSNGVRFAPRCGLLAESFLVVATLLLCLAARPVCAQNTSSAEDIGACTLHDHVYSCDGAVFQRALARASVAAIQTHNADGVGRQRLTDFITKHLGKTIASGDTPADLIFLLMPIDQTGAVFGSQGDRDLGTLRIYAATAGYSATPDGVRGPLLWAETFSGPQEMPWPLVVRGVLLQFQSHFHIK